MSPEIAAIDPVNPESDIIAKAGKIIQDNGVVIFPAQCLYGVAANALNKKAVEKVFHLKQRSLNNPILILISNKNILLDLVTTISESAIKLMNAFWPGNLTLVFEAKDHISQLLTANTGKIGIRIPVHPVAKALVESVKLPITGSSANLSGDKGCSRADKLVPSIIDHADLVIDAGILKGGAGSTIVDTSESNINILREGRISMKEINKILKD